MDDAMTKDKELERLGTVAHCERFRKVSTRYPRRVAEACGLDLERAMAASDERVAATVAAWEIEQGLDPRDWVGIGIEEGQNEMGGLAR